MKREKHIQIMRPLLAASLTLAIASLTAGVSDAGKRVEREDRRTVSAEDATALVLENPRGRVVVIGDADATEVTVVATRVAEAGSEKKARELLARLSFTIVEQDATIVIRTRNDTEERSQSLWSILRGGRTTAFIDYAVEVPRRFDVQVTATSGEARVRGIAGRARVHVTSGSAELRDIGSDSWVDLTSGELTALDLHGGLEVFATSGEIEIDGVAGSVRVEATSGNVEARRIEGNAVVRMVRGDLSIEHCLGDVVFHTSSGDAEILDVAGGINAITSSGDLDVMILPVGDKEFILGSSSGDIDVRYAAPSDFGFILDVETSTGAIEGDMPIRVERVTRRQLRGIVGTGKSRVLIETASGDVSIVEGKKHVKTPAQKTQKKQKKTKK